MKINTKMVIRMIRGGTNRGTVVVIEFFLASEIGEHEPVTVR